MLKQDWIKFLKGSQTTSQWNKAEKHANNWFSCAVGCVIDLPKPVTQRSNFMSKVNADDFITKRLTKKAERLGMKFYNCIENRDIKGARSAFKQIMGLGRVLLKHPKREVYN